MVQRIFWKPFIKVNGLLKVLKEHELVEPILTQIVQKRKRINNRTTWTPEKHTPKVGKVFRHHFWALDLRVCVELLQLDHRFFLCSEFLVTPALASSVVTSLYLLLQRWEWLSNRWSYNLHHQYATERSPNILVKLLVVVFVLSVKNRQAQQTIQCFPVEIDE